MAKFRIHRDFGFVGTHASTEVDADSIAQAEELANEYAQESVSSWAEEIEEDET